MSDTSTSTSYNNSMNDNISSSSQFILDSGHNSSYKQTFTQNVFLLLIFIILNLSFVSAQTSNITNCSTNNCLTCLNLFTCQQCLYDDSYCCPLYCSTCINMNHCLTCNNAFALESLSNGSIICTRVITSTDPNWNLSSKSCDSGFFLQPTTNSCIGCGISNCSTCTNYMACTACMSGYFLSQADFTYFINECHPCGQGCEVCQNQLNCTSCLPKFGMNGASCVACVDRYCLSCNSSGFGCNLGSCEPYAYNNQSGQPCQLCSSIANGCNTCRIFSISNYNYFICASCLPGFSVNQILGDRCINCPQNCFSCHYYFPPQCCQFQVCDICMNGFYLIKNQDNSTTCLPCAVGCLNCTDAINCLACMPKYYLNSSGNTSTCLSCPFPCLLCNIINPSLQTQFNCTQCYPGFYMISQNGSIQCLYCNISNCLNCNSSTFCLSCQQGYFLVSSAVDGSQNCQICSDCLSCQPSNNSIISQFTCLTCTLGNYLEGSSCLPCNITNCNLCEIMVSNGSNVLTCLECVVGYVLVANNPQNIPQNPYNCKPCAINNCETCNQTYTNRNGAWTVSNPFCLNCVDGYFLSNSVTCSQCSANCIECTNQQFCLICSSNFYVVQKSNTSQLCEPCPVECLYCTALGCLTCTVGYYHLGRTGFTPNLEYQCFSCTKMVGCMQCQYQNWCTLCTTNGYALYPNTFGQCIPCEQACITCDQNLVCSQCEVGYQLIIQINQCQNISSIPIWAFFSFGTLGFMITFVIIEKLIRSVRNCIQSNRLKKEPSQKVSDEQSKRVLGEDHLQGAKKSWKRKKSLIESEE